MTLWEEWRKVHDKHAAVGVHSTGCLKKEATLIAHSYLSLLYYLFSCGEEIQTSEKWSREVGRKRRFTDSNEKDSRSSLSGRGGQALTESRT